jgi:hypothetical protein
MLAVQRSMAQLVPQLRASDSATPRDIVADLPHRLDRFGQGFGEKS